LGVVDESAINNMSYVFFQDVLDALGKKVNFESISNMYGRTVFGKKDGQTITKMIQEANPLSKPSTINSAATLLSMPGSLVIVENDKEKEQASKKLGDMSWFEEYMK
jgi:hypothetical protein